MSDDSEDEENEINTSIAPEAGNDSAIFEDLIKDDHDKTMTEAEGEDKMKENCFEPGSKSSKSGEEKMEQIDTKKAEKSIVDSPITPEVLFSCSFCQKKFTFKSNLDRHERTKHNNPANEKFRCSYCEKKFSDMIKLSKHESKHRGEKPYTCSTCDQTFAHSHHLRSHERIHTGNLLSCNQCEKKFTRADHLRRHERIHTGNLLSCNQCEKKFTRAEHLKRHTKIHTRRDALIRVHCDKTFKRVDKM